MSYAPYYGYGTGGPLVVRPRPRRTAAQRGYAPGGNYGYNTGGPLHVVVNRPHAGTAGGGGGGGGGLTLWQQAQAMIAKALGPYISETNKSYDREQASRTAAISAATKEYERAVAQHGPAV